MPISTSDAEEMRRSSAYPAALWSARLAYLWLFVSLAVVWIPHTSRVLFVLWLAGLVSLLSSLMLFRRAGVPIARPGRSNVQARRRYRQFWRDVLWLPRR